MATELTKRRGSAVMPTGSHFGVLCAPRVDRTRCVRFGFSHLSRPLARLRSRSRSLMFAHHARHSTRLLPPCEHALRDHRGLLHAAGLSDHVGRRRVHLNAAEPCWLRHEPQADARILENHRPRPSCAPTPPSLSITPHPPSLFLTPLSSLTRSSALSALSLPKPAACPISLGWSTSGRITTRRRCGSRRRSTSTTS